MKRALASVTCAVVCAAAALLAPLPAASAPAPAADLTETFSTDPRLSSWWAFTGAYSWSAASGTVLSPKGKAASARWAPGLYFTGTLATRLKLMTAPVGVRHNASLVFAADAATGASRWVKITAGAPGTVALGQTGTIGGTGPRTFKTVRTPIPVNAWIDLSLTVAGDGNVTVKIGPTALFTALAAPLAGGRVGFATTKTRAAFDSFAFRGNPDAEPCRECHDPGRPGAAGPDVYTYWDGSWWDQHQGGSDAVQQGGHGDPDGKAAATCTGATGCHDLRQPNPGFHRNGSLEPRDGVTRNSYHLRAGFINASPSRPGDVQLSFDNYCYAACHKAAGVLNHRHRIEPPYFVQFGRKLSDPDASAVPAGYPLDHDLSTAADAGRPIFGPCVSCHDPHGSGCTDTSKGSNHMARLKFATASELCAICHN